MSESSDAVKRWRRNTKRKIIESMGGCCQMCGYKRCPESLDLHHINPQEKEFTFGSITANPKSWNKFIIPELKKCILICANCHREIHAGFSLLPDIYEKFDESKISKETKETKEQELSPCPICGNLKPNFQKTCSVSCGGKQSGFKRSTIDEEKIKELLGKNLSNTAIAKLLGCSEALIRKRKKEWNIRNWSL